jgi:HlyD family secretion protein
VAIRRKSPVIASLRTLYNLGAIGDMTDGQLLERFAAGGEAAELAFAALVERHGPIVLHTCRSILRDKHEAEDAFQATFLVLVRKARSLWVRDSLGPWLHQVACRAARFSRSALARRTMQARVTADMIAGRRDEGTDATDGLAAALHEAIERLPDRYRVPVVLCDLEGCTHEQAARHMGCPVGTVKSRLARARQRLRDRLSRHDLAFGTLLARGTPSSISSQLVASTVTAAGRWLSIQAFPQGTAASLALGVLGSMAALRFWKVALVMVAVCGTTTGVIALVGRVAAVAEAQPDDTPGIVLPDGIVVTEVKPGKLSVIVQERGVVQAVRNPEVYCQVEPGATIVSILPEGTWVTAGQLVCELDSSSLRAQIARQVVAVKTAEAASAGARFAREIAEIAVQEYVEGVYPEELQTATQEIALARSSIASALERLKRTQMARDQLNAMLRDQGGAKSAADVLAVLDIEERRLVAEEALAQGRRALEIGQAKRDRLEKFTRDKTIKQLRIEVEKERTAEAAQEAVCDLEKSKEATLRRQIDNCRMVSPGDGVIQYANEPSRSGQPWKPQIEVGAGVSERQKIFSVPEVSGPMRVDARVREAWVDQIAPGMTVRVKVDAFTNLTLPGTVESVAPRPDPPRGSDRGLKLYRTNVGIAKGIMRGLRPGMTATADIVIAELDNVLSVPVQAVVQYDNKHHVAVRTPEGRLEWREVALGRANDQAVEVKAGLKTGEAVVVEPGPLLTEEQKKKIALPTRKQ